MKGPFVFSTIFSSDRIDFAGLQTSCKHHSETPTLRRPGKAVCRIVCGLIGKAGETLGS